MLRPLTLVCALALALAPALAQAKGSVPKTVHLYRGLRVPPNQFVSTGVVGSAARSSTQGRIWVSDQAATAIAFATGGRHRYTTVLELELPSRLFRAQAPDSAWQKKTFGVLNGTLDQRQVPDLAPYLRRIGIVGPGRKVKWVDWRQATGKGLLARGADYGALFRALPAD